MVLHIQPKKKNAPDKALIIGEYFTTYKPLVIICCGIWHKNTFEVMAAMAFSQDLSHEAMMNLQNVHFRYLALWYIFAIYIYIYTYICMYVYIYICIYIHIYIYIYIYIYMRQALYYCCGGVSSLES